jgi:hypothetical protein
MEGKTDAARRTAALPRPQRPGEAPPIENDQKKGRDAPAFKPIPQAAYLRFLRTYSTSECSSIS